MIKRLDNIKMIFIDIDGTLCNTKNEVTEYTKNVLKNAKDKGIHIVLCSGRSNLSVCEVSKNVNASKYVIASNGAFVYNYIDDIDIFGSTMKKDILEKMWNICVNEINWELIIESKKQIYIDKLDFREESDKYTKINSIKDVNNSIFQIVINIESDKETSKIEQILSSEEEIWTPNYGIGTRTAFFDINNKNIDKGIGIQHLIKNLGIKKEETIGIGDGINDFAMFRECGIRVAMGNGKDELKRIADYITLTNDEDGVAEFIKKYTL